MKYQIFATALLSLAFACSSAAPSARADGGNAKDLFLVQLKNPAQTINNGFTYTLELHRGKKEPQVCSARELFISGDGIRVRLKSNFDGYAYIVLAQGSTGKRTVLFPPPAPGGQTSPASKSVVVGNTAISQSNLVTADREYVIPARGVIRFDKNPGVEHLLFVLSRKPIDLQKELDARTASGSEANKSDTALGDSGLLISHEPVTADASGATYVVRSDPARVVFVEVPLNHSQALPASEPAVVPVSVPVAPPAAGPVPTMVIPPLRSDSINRPVTDKWAVVVALSKYRDSSLDLKAPRKDAELFATFLAEDAGFVPSHIIKLYDKEATRANLMAALTEMGQRVRPDDLFVFYANCHGSANTVTPGNFLLLYDYGGEESLNRQLLMQDLSNLLKRQVHSERMVLIVQACHSGFVKAGSVPQAEDVSNDLQGIGRIVATACAGNESSWVYRRGGVFTMALVPNLRKYPKLKEALLHTRDDVLTETQSEPDSKQMHPVIKYDLWMGDDAVLMAKPTDPRP
ncbi:MAG: caspase family protein [Cyanobacteria bacterium SZAS LIN-3]|nr:caspase family protein [Cyanobacteria bacterium SZAS LIN-3]